MKVKVARIIPLKEVPVSFYDPARDGVTFTLLSTFKSCREKARLVLSGWTSKWVGLGMVFGSLVHGVNQLMYRDLIDKRLTSFPTDEYIKQICGKVEKIWKSENPRADAETLEHLEFSMILLEALMPIYFKYWKKDFTLFWERVEHEFKIPIEIELPTGRLAKTFLRGKIDGSFTRTATSRPVLFETKTKAYLAERGESELADILPHELQVNLYMIYLWWVDKRLPEGLLFNVIRRPGQKRKKHETTLAYAKRVAADIRLRPEYYFVRMQMMVTRRDLEKNEMEIRDLVSDFILWWNGHAGHYKNSDACQNKYGTCGFLPVCARGDYTGLYKRDKVFRELADEL